MRALRDRGAQTDWQGDQGGQEAEAPLETEAQMELRVVQQKTGNPAKMALQACEEQQASLVKEALQEARETPVNYALFFEKKTFLCNIFKLFSKTFKVLLVRMGPEDLWAPREIGDLRDLPENLA